MSRKRDRREVIRLAHDLGWRHEGDTANNHLRFRNAHGYLVVTSSHLPTAQHWHCVERMFHRCQDKRPESISEKENR